MLETLLRLIHRRVRRLNRSGGAGSARKLTALEATHESSHTVEEADQVLQALTPKDHLEVRIEHGRLLHALGERNAPHEGVWLSGVGELLKGKVIVL